MPVELDDPAAEDRAEQVLPVLDEGWHPSRVTLLDAAPNPARRALLIASAVVLAATAAVGAVLPSLIS